MNPVHNAIVSHIREDESGRFKDLSDEQLVRHMFSNYREGKGLRLTHHGLQIMRSYFSGYEIKVPPDEIVKPVHLIFLDSKARMPYYCGEKEIVVYDYLLGVKLRLVDGRLSILMLIED